MALVVVGDSEYQFTTAKKSIEARYADVFSAPFWESILENGRHIRNRIVSITPLRFLT